MTQQKRQSLAKDIKLAELYAENEYCNFFLEPEFSSTNHVHKIVDRAKQ